MNYEVSEIATTSPPPSTAQPQLSYLAEKKLADIHQSVVNHGAWTNESLVTLTRKYWWQISILVFVASLTLCNSTMLLFIVMGQYGFMDKIESFLSLFL